MLLHGPMPIYFISYSISQYFQVHALCWPSGARFLASSIFPHKISRTMGKQWYASCTIYL